jgi:hypothetical protein
LLIWVDIAMRRGRLSAGSVKYKATIKNNKYLVFIVMCIAFLKICMGEKASFMPAKSVHPDVQK